MKDPASAAGSFSQGEGSVARGTKLWQAAGSPIIQGRSRTERPFWRDAVLAVAMAALIGAVADWALSAPYALRWSELAEFASALLASAQIGLIPCIAAVWLGRGMGWSRVSLPAGILGGAVAAAFLAFGWRFF